MQSTHRAHRLVKNKYTCNLTEFSVSLNCRLTLVDALHLSFALALEFTPVYLPVHVQVSEVSATESELAPAPEAESSKEVKSASLGSQQQLDDKVPTA